MSDNNPADKFGAGSLHAKIARQEKEIERLRDALYESSQSLRTISILAGKKDGDLIDFMQVRGYANSRYMVAEQALVMKGSE